MNSSKTRGDGAPVISLVIPVYNRPDMIATCLKSLAPSLEHLRDVIVVDDGSTDNATPAAIEATISEMGAGDTIRLIRQENAGPGAARNTGVAAATGDWIAFLDSDDLWLPWSGKELCDCIERHPDIAAIFENARPFADLSEVSAWTQEPLREVVHEDFFALTRVRPRIVRTGSGYFAIRRHIFAQSGGFVPGLRGSEDSDFFYRIAREGAFVALEYPALIARRTGGDDSLTLNMSALSEGLYFLMEGRRSGRYGPPDRDLDHSLADLLAFWIHALFYGGWGREAYDLLLRRGGFGLMMRNGHRKNALKLVSIPVLSVIRPRNHKFSWRPKAN
mgnify:CR=1 FL=1|jgi:glycosyltransferase involved in cell wall biosynthesis|tara:strand:+ start:507 stop:1505 length:999 start_codon:yes stop_codon:yes gene_type:complete